MTGVSFIRGRSKKSIMAFKGRIGFALAAGVGLPIKEWLFCMASGGEMGSIWRPHLSSYLLDGLPGLAMGGSLHTINIYLRLGFNFEPKLLSC